jgi:uncharacterized protein (DUF427 family)
MPREMKVPGPDHPITVRPNPRRVTVRVGDRVVADTTAALVLSEATYPAVQYVPIADVDPEVLTPSDSHTYCPYKGEASYYHLAGGDGDIADAVWTYTEPYAAVGAIASHVAFYPRHVRISESEPDGSGT